MSLCYWKLLETNHLKLCAYSYTVQLQKHIFPSQISKTSLIQTGVFKGPFTQITKRVHIFLAVLVILRFFLVSWLLWIIHTAHCEHFSSEILSTEEVVAVPADVAVELNSCLLISLL